MAFFDTRAFAANLKKRKLFIFGRLFFRLVKGQETTAKNTIDSHLKSLPDEVLEDYGYSKEEIKWLRKSSENSEVF